jgi:hypothetical protein
VGSRVRLSLFVFAIGAVAASNASATNVCGGPVPAPGKVVHGPVLVVPDGSSLCVALGASPSNWVKLPLSKMSVARGTLMAAAFGKNATCRVGARGEATCDIEGEPLAALVGRPELLRAAYAWR